ncbi:MAG: hypothetical protein ACYDAI_14785 [Trichloromonadaceae bacterium]
MDIATSPSTSMPPPPVKRPPPATDSFLSRFARGVKNLLLMLLIGLALLWNWDGFWQTNIGFLRSSQERYLPAKVAQEQQKLSNIGLHNSELEKLRAQVQLLETQLVELKIVGTREQKKGHLEAALQIIETLSGKIPPEQLEELRRGCNSQECEEIFSRGRALLE